MGFLDLADHLLSFGAPAFAVALLVTLAAPLLMPKGVHAPGWWGRVALNFAAGLAASGAGLWVFGHDGKMVTYAVLVLAVATMQWLAGRGWRA